MKEGKDLRGTDHLLSPFIDQLVNAMQLLHETVEHLIFFQMLQAGKNLCREIFSFDARERQRVAKLFGKLRDTLLDQRLNSIGQLKMFDTGRDLPLAVAKYDLPLLT